MKSFLFLVALVMCSIATAVAPIVMEKKPNHFKQYKVVSHGDLTDQNKDRKASIGSGWWTLGEKKQPKDRKEEPEDNEPGDVPDVWRPKPILKRKIYNDCYHPVSNQRIHHGSYSYHKESCLMCMCPFGRMKCELTDKSLVMDWGAVKGYVRSWLDWAVEYVRDDPYDFISRLFMMLLPMFIISGLLSCYLIREIDRENKRKEKQENKKKAIKKATQGKDKQPKEKPKKKKKQS